MRNEEMDPFSRSQLPKHTPGEKPTLCSNRWRRENGCISIDKELCLLKASTQSMIKFSFRTVFLILKEINVILENLGITKNILKIITENSRIQRESIPIFTSGLYCARSPIFKVALSGQQYTEYNLLLVSVGTWLGYSAAVQKSSQCCTWNPGFAVSKVGVQAQLSYSLAAWTLAMLSVRWKHYVSYKALFEAPMK